LPAVYLYIFFFYKGTNKYARITILKQGEWNTMRIRVQGDNVQTWLNGEEMVNIRDEKIGAGQGRIALQIHDGGGIKVLWRNLHLQTL